MPPYRAVVIGCGLIGSQFQADAKRVGTITHAGAYTACDQTILVGLCDRDPAKLDAAARLWGTQAHYVDPAQLLIECHPEIVSICTPDHTHALLLQQAIDTPGVKAILAEKPLAASESEAAEILEMARQRGVAVMVNYSRRFASNHRRLKAALQSGCLGEIIAVNGVYTKGLFHNGTHWIDLARWLVGEIKTVQGYDVLLETESDPTIDLRMEFESGPTGTLTGLRASDYAVFEMDLIGSRGRARIHDSGWSVELAAVEDSPRYSGYRALTEYQTLAGDLRDTALHAVNELVAHLNDPSQRLSCTGEDGLQALRVATAARRSLEMQQPQCPNV